MLKIYPFSNIFFRILIPMVKILNIYIFLNFNWDISCSSSHGKASKRSLYLHQVTRMNLFTFIFLTLTNNLKFLVSGKNSGNTKKGYTFSAKLPYLSLLLWIEFECICKCEWKMFMKMWTKRNKRRCSRVLCKFC